MMHFFHVLLFFLYFNNVNSSRGDSPTKNFTISNRALSSWLDSNTEEVSDSTEDISSSQEKMKWKDEWRQLWLQKKLEAINSTVPAGDVVNMVAARPWGVSCGDPDHHDEPWGSCVLPVECADEYRIYRGDYSCGNTQYVCCAVQLTNYDLYGGFDISFEDTSLESDSAEKKWGDDKAKEKRRKKKKRRHQRKQRQKERKKRKERIKKVIKRIVREIRKILSRQYRNTTSERKKRTSQLKKFIKMLKKKYKHDRRLVKDIHQQDFNRLDQILQARLMEVRDMNKQFSKVEAFREMVKKGLMNRTQLRTLLKQYPELEGELELENPRRKGDDTSLPYYVEDDPEYGYIYV